MKKKDDAGRKVDHLGGGGTGETEGPGGKRRALFTLPTTWEKAEGRAPGVNKEMRKGGNNSKGGKRVRLERHKASESNRVTERIDDLRGKTKGFGERLPVDPRGTERTTPTLKQKNRRNETREVNGEGGISPISSARRLGKKVGKAEIVPPHELTRGKM